jgi:hypothetical protein
MIEQCVNKLVIELLFEGEIFDYNYISRSMNSIDVCNICPGYNQKCNKYRPSTIEEKFRLYLDGVIFEETINNNN